MKKILSFLFLLFFITACAPSTPAIPPTLPPVIKNTPPPQTIQFTPIPTLTVAPLPTEGFPTFVPPTNTQPPAGQPAVIQFPANGTYAEIIDIVPMNTSKTYSVNAMKGQVMSVSVLRKPPMATGVTSPCKSKARMEASFARSRIEIVSPGAAYCPPRRIISSRSAQSPT